MITLLVHVPVSPVTQQFVVEGSECWNKHKRQPKLQQSEIVSKTFQGRVFDRNVDLYIVPTASQNLLAGPTPTPPPPTLSMFTLMTRNPLGY